MGLFDRSSTTQTTNQFVDQTEVGISELGNNAVGFVGGNLTVQDQGAIDLAKELGGTSVDAVSSIASQALDTTKQAQYDYYKASGDFAKAAFLSSAASQQAANDLANSALFRIAESVNPNAASPDLLTSTSRETLIKYGLVIVGLIAAAYFATKGR